VVGTKGKGIFHAKGDQYIQKRKPPIETNPTPANQLPDITAIVSFVPALNSSNASSQQVLPS
jgi:hypothetical protein